MSGIDHVLTTLSTGVTARPRLTHYDTRDGIPERIELSGRVLVNWVNKAANLLREEFDAEPGTRVALDLPAGHWRAVYWALATWAVGATLVVPEPGQDEADDADVIVSQAPGEASQWPPRVVVTLAALARRHPDGVPQGAFDEAAVLSTYGDVFDDIAAVDPDEPALVSGAETVTFDDLGPAPGAGAGAERVLLLDPDDPAAILGTMLATWAADGSVVVVRRTHDTADPNATDEALRRIEETEGVTRRG